MRAVLGASHGQAGDVFADEVEFEVYFAAGGDGMDVRVFERIGDDGDIEFGLFYIEDGKAGTVEADGAFFDHEMAEFLWKFEAEFPAAVEVFSVEAGGGRVDMSLDDMAVEPAVHDHTSFEVDEVAGLPIAEAAFFEGFFDGRHAVEIVFLFFHGEADAVMGDALIDL
jgi:hypothetical protein